jgi:triacylglycerol esterase/lipase EstA (alpha/beta hydrolase family)
MPTDYDPIAARDRIILEALSAAAHGLMFGLGYLPSRHRPKRARDIRTLVFVHGLWASRASFFPLQGYLRVFRHSRQLSLNYRSSGSIEQIALELKRSIDEQVRGGRIDLVCHSLGGLVARFYLQQLGGARRVDRLVTLATPHRGTHASVYIPTRIVSDLRPGSAFLRSLDALPEPDGVGCLSVSAGRDLMVLPAQHAFAPFGERIAFDDLGHLDVLLSPRVFEVVRNFLSREPLAPER